MDPSSYFSNLPDKYSYVEKFSRLMKLTPSSLIARAVFFSILIAFLYPVHAWNTSTSTFNLLGYYGYASMRELAIGHLALFLVLAPLSGLVMFIIKYSYGKAGLDVSFLLRSHSYRAILSKHIGWFD
mmetsp:Transcript_19980/g.14690  ORF Transcript_19980/g.14690 Transcript_19980/m.14690 type:complete len:127 (+) Transcript_19980:44-424(+)